MTPDGQLLHRYAEEHSEEAFRELVQRYLDLVYSTALRRVNGDSHLSHDISQTVFNDLARKAATLSHRSNLAGWLYTSTHFAAAKAIRRERRRHFHEQESHAMQEILQSSAADVDWDKLRPVLDQVMHDLKEIEREAIILRYFENRQLSDVGECLGVGEDAARKRIDRALDKLRGFLLKRGITTTVLATTLSAHAVQTAPVGLAATLSSVAVAGTLGTGAAVGFLKLLTMTKLQLSLIGAVAIGGVATTLIIEKQNQARLRAENASLNTSLRQQMQQMDDLQVENERFSHLAASAGSKQTMPSEQFKELLRLRNEVGSLRQQTNEMEKRPTEIHQSKAVAPQNLAAAAVMPEGLPRDAWTFAGYADPESAFLSSIWARSRNDVENVIASLGPGKEADDMQGKTKEEIHQSMLKETDFDGITGFKILDKEMISDNEAILTVFADGTRKLARFRMVRVGSEWKFSAPIKDAYHAGSSTPAQPQPH